MKTIRNNLTLLVLILAAHCSALGADSDSYRFKLSLDTKAGELSGIVCIDYVNNSEQPLREIRLRLDTNLSTADSMLIAAVKDDDGKELPWRHISANWGQQSSEKGQMAIALPRPLETGGITRLDMEYRYTGKSALSPTMIVLQDDPYPSLDAWYPKAMSFRDGTWSYDDDRPADYNVELDLPDNLVIASTGSVIDERRDEEGRVTLHLKADKVRGFTTYGSELWRVHSKKAHGVDLRCFVSKEHERWAERLLSGAADAVDYYRTEYGEYPCTHVDIICPTAGSGGGAFAACNVIGIFMTRNLEQKYRWLIAHEVAHQYFGNLINQPRNEVNWVLLGLGMVMDRHYLLDRGLDDKMHRQVMNFYPMVKRQGRNTSLSQTVEDLTRAEKPWSWQWNLALGHGKAFAVCSLLEDLLGEEQFKKVIKKVIAEHAGGMITASDLIDYCEKACGNDLSWFFAAWIRGDATLNYAITNVRKAKAGWEVEVSQLGTAAFPVLVEATTQSGDKLRQRISRTMKVNLLSFAAEEKLVSVVVDPDGVCPDMDTSDNRWPGDSNR